MLPIEKEQIKEHVEETVLCITNIFIDKKYIFEIKNNYIT